MDRRFGKSRKLTAIAVKDSLIVYVGDDYQSFVGSGTVLTDMKGRMLVPGFIDNHTHFLEGGYYLANINLRYVKSMQDFISKFSAFFRLCKKQQLDIGWQLGS